VSWKIEIGKEKRYRGGAEIRGGGTTEGTADTGKEEAASGENEKDRKQVPRFADSARDDFYLEGWPR
jgi:hypothetical protein